jgi:signal transduction histidine kinase
MPDGSKIKISTEIHDDKVKLKVCDNGLGMSQETKNRVFEPFFAAKNQSWDHQPR